MLNPLLNKETWTFPDMAVAQDWELEQGNEGALIWTDLGPELARMVCENPEVLETLAGFVVGPRVWAGAWARAGTGAWTWAWARAGAMAGAKARAGAGVRAGEWARAGARAGEGAGAWALARVRAGAGAGAWAGARTGSNYA